MLLGEIAGHQNTSRGTVCNETIKTPLVGF